MTTPQEDPKRKELAVRLLKAALAHDSPMVTMLLDEFGANPNCAFDGIPLLCAVAAQDVPLPIIKKLHAYGADATKTVKAPIAKIGSTAFNLAKNEQTKQFLHEQYKIAVDQGDTMGMDSSATSSPFEAFTLGQFSRDYERFLLEEPEYYYKAEWPSWEKSRDNGIPVEVFPDTRLSLLDSGREIIAIEKGKGVTAKAIDAAFVKHDKLNMN